MSDYIEPVNFIDLKAQFQRIGPQIEEGMRRVLAHGTYIQGPEVRELEKQLAIFSGAKAVVTCANGTDALEIVLKSLELSSNHAVLVPAFTYVATAEAVVAAGATPLFVDVDENTFNLDPMSLEIGVSTALKKGLDPKVVIPVDLFGQPADLQAINRIARKYSLLVLVDAAQSFGSLCRNEPVGVRAQIATTSFFPAKPLGCYGDGGAIMVESEERADLIRSIALHGRGEHKYEHVRIGQNSRLDTIQAAILIEKLKIFEEELCARDLIAKRYSFALKSRFRIPEIADDLRSSWAQYTLRHDSREKITRHLRDCGIPSQVYYPIPLSEQPFYSKYPVVEGGVPISNALAGQVFSIPMHPYLLESEQDRIIQALLKF